MGVKNDAPATEWLHAAIEAARAAAAHIMQVYERAARPTVHLKQDCSPVTEADLGANARILECLAPTGLPFFSEEGEQPTWAERAQWSRFWLVDPLDGTKEFLRRNGEFTVNIALIEEGAPVLGVICQPTTGLLCYAMQHQGTWQLLPGADKPTRLHARPFHFSQPGLDVLVSHSATDPQVEAFIGSLNQPRVSQLGSTLKSLRIAAGQADLYPRHQSISEWDIAAAHIIVQEAGGKMLSLHQRTPLRYNKPNLLTGDFLVMGQEQHAD